VLIGTSRGITYYIPFLTCGIFLFTFTTQTVLAGTRAIADNLNLIRALHFPRACMPLALMLEQFQQLGFSIAALLAICFLAGAPVTLKALLLIAVLAMLAVFSAGLAMIFARTGAKNTDMSQVMPFVMRTWMYASGVIYDLHTVHIPQFWRTVLELNPMAIYIDLARQSLNILKTGTVLPRHVWLMGFAWAVVVGIAGYVWFWKAEEEYGRG